MDLSGDEEELPEVPGMYHLISVRLVREIVEGKARGLGIPYATTEQKIEMFLYYLEHDA